MAQKNENSCSVYAFVGKTESAKAELAFYEGRGILVSSYIRYRDRNTAFAEKFIHKLIEISDKEFGPELDIQFDDKQLKELISHNDHFFFNKRISFK